jgi:hypothetical protein
MVAKQVQMDGKRARRLERLAAAEGTTSDVLIERALDLLFQTHASGLELPEELQADWELLQELEAELGPLEPPSAPPIRPEEVRFVVGTPVRRRILRLGEPS